MICIFVIFLITIFQSCPDSRVVVVPTCSKRKICSLFTQTEIVQPVILERMTLNTRWT